MTLWDTWALLSQVICFHVPPFESLVV
jgi:hypothetical protein